jgi:hypothetical protein
MGNLFVLVGASYAVALFVQIICYMQSVKKAQPHAEKETVEAGLMAPQNV